MVRRQILVIGRQENHLQMRECTPAKYTAHCPIPEHHELPNLALIVQNSVFLILSQESVAHFTPPFDKFDHSTLYSFTYLLSLDLLHISSSQQSHTQHVRCGSKNLFLLL